MYLILERIAGRLSTMSIIFHVRFFGDKGRRAWVKFSNMIPFTKENDLDVLAKTASFAVSFSFVDNNWFSSLFLCIRKLFLYIKYEKLIHIVTSKNDSKYRFECKIVHLISQKLLYKAFMQHSNWVHFYTLLNLSFSKLTEQICMYSTTSQSRKMENSSTRSSLRTKQNNSGTF